MKTFRCAFLGLALVLAVTLKLPADNQGEQPQKVTSMTMPGGHSDEGAAQQMPVGSAKGTVQTDIDSIRRDVTGSIPLVIIKALALAAAVGGVAYLYVGRSRKGKAG